MRLGALGDLEKTWWVSLVIQIALHVFFHGFTGQLLGMFLNPSVILLIFFFRSGTRGFGPSSIRIWRMSTSFLPWPDRQGASNRSCCCSDSGNLVVTGKSKEHESANQGKFSSQNYDLTIQVVQRCPRGMP